ncbi:hypothetical protein UFOVP71_187 [uncultured Caudovirales phage]|uniref:Uncharacterized protein n=1 Tax=uncultured Caudovirales phage TaxID=2100421 RepID=A0A6J5TBI9_9CAUD|nr:hypothetical protein UFOVP71_187 [uncultured Caudovirales phage]
MKDLLGFSFTLGCTVARPVLFGKSPVIEICKVTRIDSGKLYLDDSKQAMKIPSRLLIIEHDPLIKMMDDHNKEIKNENS